MWKIGSFERTRRETGRGARVSWPDGRSPERATGEGFGFPSSVAAKAMPARRPADAVRVAAASHGARRARATAVEKSDPMVIPESEVTGASAVSGCPGAGGGRPTRPELAECLSVFEYTPRPGF